MGELIVFPVNKSRSHDQIQRVLEDIRTMIFSYINSPTVFMNDFDRSYFSVTLNDWRRMGLTEEMIFSLFSVVTNRSWEILSTMKGQRDTLEKISKSRECVLDRYREFCARMQAI